MNKARTARAGSFWIACLAGIGMSAPIIRAAEEQSGSAAELYLAHCSSCHGAHMDGGQFGPTLKGAAFHAKWMASSNGSLFDFISRKMPPAAPGSLTAAEYRAISTFILRSDEAVAGSNTGNAVQPSLPAAPDRHLGPVPADQYTFADERFRHVAADRKRALDRLTPVDDDLLASPPAGDWLNWRRTQDMHGFSPLRQIDRKTVGALTVAWAWALPAGANESAPLIHDGVMFIQSANQVQALDAADGTLLWKYSRDLPPQFRGGLYGLHRNFAIYGGNLYLSTADRHVIALSARTGKLIWDVEIVPAATQGILLSAGPIAVRGKIIQGTSISLNCKSGCSIVALDAATGKQAWRLGTVAHQGEPGGDTWNGAPDDERFGGAVWVPGSYDKKTKLVYFGTGSTYYIAPLLGPAGGNSDGLFMDSTLAIDPDTGRLAWHHQHLPGDFWDLDEAFERTLLRLPVDGVERNIVLTIGKLGIMDALDPATGSFLFSKDLGLQNLVTSIDVRTGRRTVDSRLRPEPGDTKTVCPSPEGARNWMATVYNPRTRILYIPMEETCMDFKWQPASGSSPDTRIDIGWTVKPRPGSDGNYGRVQAIDMQTRKTLWLRRQRSPLSSSLIATAGGLVFKGDRDRHFAALDDRTGKILWSTRLDGAPNASPVTYIAGGRQYVAVASGGGGPHDSESVEITPETDNAAAATTLWVFALPSSPGRGSGKH
jgi:alcohol dehydrogenase (cytochrome c)